MDIRQTVNERPLVTAVGTGVAVLLVLVIIWAAAQFGSAGTVDAPPDKQLFSVDDGATWFAAGASNIPPFQREGKAAVRAVVWRCPHGEQFVSHLERYVATEKQRLEALPERSRQANTVSADPISMRRGLEVKRPGDQRWISADGANEYYRMTQPLAPDGCTQNLERVTPQ